MAVAPGGGGSQKGLGTGDAVLPPQPQPLPAAKVAAPGSFDLEQYQGLVVGPKVGDEDSTNGGTGGYGTGLMGQGQQGLPPRRPSTMVRMRVEPKT